MATAGDGGSALLVVDVQNDFADPAGSLAVGGAVDIIPAINAAIAEARSARTLVVYTQDWHPEHTPHFQQDGGIWPVHCVANTWGSAFHPGLDVIEGAQPVRKGTSGEDGYSAFSVRDPRTGATAATVLESILRDHAVTRLAICGLATDYCVKESALDARALGFAVEVSPRTARAVDLRPGDGDRAFEAMRAAGVGIVE